MDKMTEIPRIDKKWPCNIPDGRWIDQEGWEVWIRDGAYHREDGPAIITDTGVMIWCVDGDRHRADGPASIYPDGDVAWWWHDEMCSFERWLKATDEITDSQKVLLKLKYGQWLTNTHVSCMFDL